MKKTFSIYTLLLTAFIAVNSVACDKSNGAGGNDIAATPDSITFTAEGGTQNVAIASERDWSVADHEEWITVGETDGRVSITVQATGEAREGSVTLDNGAEQATVTVIQTAPAEKPIDETITADPASLSFTAETEPQTITVTSELEWTWTVAPDESWITVVRAGNQLTVSVAENTTEAREGALTLDNGLNQVSINISQQAPEGPKPPQMSDYLGNYTFDVTLRNRETGETSHKSYADRMTVFPNDKGRQMANFSNALGEGEEFGTETTRILFEWNGTTMDWELFAFYIPYGGIYVSFVGLIIPDSGEFAGQPSLVPEWEMSLDPETGKLSFPTEFSHPDTGTRPAYYALWMFDNATNQPLGMWSDNYMTDVTVIKTK